MSNSIGVFGIAIVIGYFILPIILRRDTIRFYLSRTTNSESAWRDHSLKFLTDRLSWITPNFVSVIGLILVAYIAYLFRQEAASWFLFVVILVAGFTDMLDGSLARNSKRVTKLGAILDVTRDVLLALVVSYYLIAQDILADDLFLWFIVGWIFLGGIRIFEFKFASGRIFGLEEDYKFVLDRVRLIFAWIGALLLVLVPYSISIYTIAETIIIASIVCSWISLVFHSAHLKILRDEKRGIPEDLG